MRLDFPRTVLALVGGVALLACPSGGADDTTTFGTTPTTTATPTTSMTQGDATSPTGADATEGCPSGQLGCPCNDGDLCDGDAVCVSGTCQSPGGGTATDTGDTTGEPTTTGVAAMCGNGSAEPGDFCLSPASTPFPMGAGTISVAIGTMDADGLLDVVAANRDANTVSFRPGNGMGGFGVETTFPCGTTPVDLAIGDFNADSSQDIVTANQGTIDITVMNGMGNGMFAGPVGLPIGGVGSIVTSVAAADLDNDSDDDIVVSDSTTSMVHVLRAEPPGFLPLLNLATGPGPASILLADFNDDMVEDIATADAGGTISLLLGNGLGQFGGANTDAAGASPTGVGAGDANGDGDVDAVVANATSNSVSLLLGDGLGGFGGSLPFPVGASPQALVVVDLDLDGNPDVATANAADGTVTILRGNGSGSFVEALVVPVGATPSDIVAADLNDDGLLDLVTADTGSSGISVILSDA